MNKVLQKSFYRLRTLLLLMVMFVTGSSAWADSVTFNAGTFTSSASATSSNVTITFPSKGSPLWGFIYSVAEFERDVKWTVSSSDKLIQRVTVECGQDTWCTEFEATNGIGSASTNSNGTVSTWNLSEGTSSIEFKWKKATCFQKITVELTDGGGSSEPAGPTTADFDYLQNNSSTENGVTFSATAGTFSSSYFAWNLPQSASISFTAPAGNVITDIVLNAASGKTVNLTSNPSGAVLSNGNATLTWTGRMNAVTFTNNQSNQYIQSATVTYEPASDADKYTYTVNLIEAPANTEITVGTKNYKHGDEIVSDVPLKNSDVIATAPTGYRTPTVNVTTDYSDNTGEVAVTYVPMNLNYTLVFENAPGTATATIKGNTYNGNTTFPSDDEIKSTDVKASETDDLWAEVSVVGTTITITYHTYEVYTVVVNGGEGEGGVTFGGKNYTNGQTIKNKTAISEVTAVNVVGYSANTNITDHTITVNYTEIEMEPFSLYVGDIIPANNASVSSIATIRINNTNVGKTFKEQAETVGTLQIDGVDTPCKYRFYSNQVVVVLGATRGGSFSEEPYTTAGQHVVTIPANVIRATDGSKNREISINYTIIASAKVVSPSNAAIDNFGFAEGFHVIFTKPIKSIADEYSIVLNLPDYTEVNWGQLAANHFTVTGFGTTELCFVPKASFWTTYGENMKHNGYPRIDFKAGSLMDTDNITNANWEMASFNYTYVAPTSAVTAPAENVEVSLDDQADGFRYLELTFDKNFLNNVSYAAGDALPTGFNLTLPTDVTRGNITATANDNKLRIYLNGGDVAGDYRVQINQGILAFVDATFGEGVNAVVDKTWTLTPATKFRVNTSSDIDTKYEGNDNNFTSEGTLASLKSFVVAAPEGDTFTAPVEATMTLEVTVGEAEATDVEMGVALGTAGLTFTFPDAISEKTHVSVAFPEGALTTTSGLSSRVFNANFNIDPTEYVNISTDLVDASYGSPMDGPLETITITLPVGKVAATVGTEITLNNQPIAVSAPAEFTDNTVVLTLATPLTGTEATEWNTFVIPEGFITTTDGAINRSITTNNVKVVKRLKVARIEVNGVELTNETTFDEIQGVRVYFDETFGEYQYMPAGMTMKLGETPVAINNGFASGSTDNFYFYFSEGNYVSAAGTYDVHIPAGTLTSGDGHVNKDIDFSIVVNAYEPVAMELAPVNEKTGDVYEYLQNFTLTAPEGKTFNAEKGLKKFSFDGNNYTASNVQFAQDGSSVSFSLNNKVTTDGNHTIVLPEGFVKTTDGKTNAQIEVTYEVGYPYYTLGNVMPSTSNEVMYLETLTINRSYSAADFAEVAEATAITLSVNENAVAATYTATANQVVITLPSEINTAGEYTIAIPAGVISAGGKTNEAKEITYTVAGDYALESYSPSTYADLDDLSYIVVAPARYDVEFDEVPANVTITVNGDNVTASVAKNNNELTLTFAEITKGGSYEVVIPAGTFNAGHGKGNAEFSRTYKVSAKVAISAAGWTSFCLDAPFKLAAGFTPYYVTGTEDNGITLTLEKVKPVLEEQDTNMDFTSYGWNPATHFANYNNEYLTITTTGSFSNSTGSLAGTGTIEFSTGETGAVIKSIEVVPYRNDNNYVNYCYFDGNGDNTTKELSYSANSESVTMHASFGYVSYINVTVAAPTGDVVIPAGEGILIQGGQGAVSYTKLPVGTPTSVIEDNMLVGKLVTETITDDPDNFYYKFTLNKDQDPNSAGFYWGSADGHSITMNPNKAYIIRPASAGIRNRFLINGFDEETTAIDAVDNVTDEAPIYNLQGQRVNVARAGVYIKNGKKFIAK